MKSGLYAIVMIFAVFYKIKLAKYCDSVFYLSMVKNVQSLKIWIQQKVSKSKMFSGKKTVKIRIDLKFTLRKN